MSAQMGQKRGVGSTTHLCMMQVAACSLGQLFNTLVLKKLHVPRYADNVFASIFQVASMSLK